MRKGACAIWLLAATALVAAAETAGPGMREATAETVIASFRKFVETTPRVKVACTIDESGENESRLRYEVTLEKPGSLRSDCFSAQGELLEEIYAAVPDRMTYHMPKKKRAVIEETLSGPLLSFSPMSLPWGTDLFTNTFLSADPEKTFAAMRRYYRLAGSDDAAGVPCWVVEAERRIAVATREVPPGAPREDFQKTLIAGRGDGSVVTTKGTAVYRDAEAGETPHVLCKSRIWIGKADGIPRRSFLEQVSLEGNWGPVRMLTEYTKVEMRCDAPDALFAFVPPSGTRIVDNTSEGREAAKTGLFPTGKPAPDFEMTTLDGETRRLSDLKGKVVVLDFYDTGEG